MSATSKVAEPRANDLQVLRVRSIKEVVKSLSQSYTVRHVNQRIPKSFIISEKLITSIYILSNYETNTLYIFGKRQFTKYFGELTTVHTGIRRLIFDEAADVCLYYL